MMKTVDRRCFHSHCALVEISKNSKIWSTSLKHRFQSALTKLIDMDYAQIGDFKVFAKRAEITFILALTCPCSPLVGRSEKIPDVDFKEVEL